MSAKFKRIIAMLLSTIMILTNTINIFAAIGASGAGTFRDARQEYEAAKDEMALTSDAPIFR